MSIASGLTATISSTGISAPAYNDVLSGLQSQVQGIFGSDTVLTSDSQEGQLVAIFAQVISDSNDTAISVYNSFSPAFAQGAGLSSVVKINGITRLTATNSTCNVLITGVAGTIINNGSANDTTGNTWNLPTQVIIPSTGSITVLATAQNVGSIYATIGTITTIATPTLGWQSVTNTSNATLGSPVETDAELRIRQSISTSTGAVAINNSIAAAVANVPGVIQSVLYENSTGSPDANGVPAHSICVVTNGGSPIAICNAIASKKTPGTGTYGSTSETVSIGGTSTVINYYPAVIQTLSATITIHALPGYTSTMGANCEQALINFITGLEIGSQVYLTAAQGACLGSNYHLVSIAFGINGGPQSVADVTIPFNGLASLTLANIILALV